jgi:hypothetical protein
MKCEIETITPEIAKSYLEHSKNNYRKYDSGTARAYAADMVAGKWQENGEAIKINKKGEIVDGQHRLMAIVLSGVSQRMLVLHDLENDVYIFDVGKGRTISQITKADGFSFDNSAISAASWLVDPQSRFRSSSKGVVIQHLNDHETEWAESASITRRGQSSKTQLAHKAPIVLAVYCLMHLGRDTQLLKDFFEIVNTGFPNQDYESSPAIVLRNFLLSTNMGDFPFRDR